MEESANLDWNKLERHSKTAGLRDGIEAGRQSDFQNSFDLGYKSGFTNGFQLGLLKAQIKDKSDENFDEKRGNCVLCKDSSSFELKPEEKEKIQWESTQTFISTTNDKKLKS